jgi:hypothetical protein
MKRIIFSLALLLVAVPLLALPPQIAHGAVIEDVRYGPSCQPATCLSFDCED